TSREENHAVGLRLAPRRGPGPPAGGREALRDDRPAARDRQGRATRSLLVLHRRRRAAGARDLPGARPRAPAGGARRPPRAGGGDRHELRLPIIEPGESDAALAVLRGGLRREDGLAVAS